jgi:hypothetical protein
LDTATSSTCAGGGPNLSRARSIRPEIAANRSAAPVSASLIGLFLDPFGLFW